MQSPSPSPQTPPLQITSYYWPPSANNSATAGAELYSFVNATEPQLYGGYENTKPTDSHHHHHHQRVPQTTQCHDAPIFETKDVSMHNGNFLEVTASSNTTIQRSSFPVGNTHPALYGVEHGALLDQRRTENSQGLSLFHLYDTGSAYGPPAVVDFSSHEQLDQSNNVGLASFGRVPMINQNFAGLGYQNSFIPSVNQNVAFLGNRQLYSNHDLDSTNLGGISIFDQEFASLRFQNSFMPSINESVTFPGNGHLYSDDDFSFANTGGVPMSSQAFPDPSYPNSSITALTHAPVPSVAMPNPPYFTEMPTTPRTHCLWPACTKSFARASDLDRHWESIHQGIRHHCNWPGCPNNRGLGYGRLDKLRAHKKEKHGVV